MTSNRFELAVAAALAAPVFAPQPNRFIKKKGRAENAVKQGFPAPVSPLYVRAACLRDC